VSAHHSFSVRLPNELYLQVASLAQRDGMKLNAKVNQLIKLGLGEHISLDEALRRRLMETVLGEDN